ncbi:MAG: hypothetical protein ABI165_16145 [Bryobacteraceae bacterium]
MKFVLILGVILLLLGVGVFTVLFTGIVPVSDSLKTPDSFAFMAGFVGALGGAALCLLYLCLWVWQRMYKKP